MNDDFHNEVPIPAVSLSVLSSCQNSDNYPDTCEESDQLPADIFELSDKLQSEFTEAGYFWAI